MVGSHVDSFQGTGGGGLPSGSIRSDPPHYKRLKLKFIISKIDQFIGLMVDLHLLPGGIGSSYAGPGVSGSHAVAPPAASSVVQFFSISLGCHPDDTRPSG